MHTNGVSAHTGTVHTAKAGIAWIKNPLFKKFGVAAGITADRHPFDEKSWTFRPYS